MEDARERFPDVAELAFPAEGREWGVQNLYIQMLADAGIVGLALLVLVGAGRPRARVARGGACDVTRGLRASGSSSLCGLLTLGAEWASLGIVAGIPLQAATCLLLGLAAAGAATLNGPR